MLVKSFTDFNGEFFLQALQTKAAIGEREGKIDNKTRIELIKEEERKIEEERQEARTQAKAKEELETAKKELLGMYFFVQFKVMKNYNLERS